VRHVPRRLVWIALLALAPAVSCRVAYQGPTLRKRSASEEAVAAWTAFSRAHRAIDEAEAFSIHCACREDVAAWEIERRRVAAGVEGHRISSAEIEALLREVTYSEESVDAAGGRILSRRRDDGGLSYVASYDGADTVVVTNRSQGPANVLIAPGPIKLYDYFEVMDFYFPVQAHFWDRARGRMLLAGGDGGPAVGKGRGNGQDMESRFDVEQVHAGADPTAGDATQVFYCRRFPQVFFSKIWLDSATGLPRRLQEFQARRDAYELPGRLDARGRLAVRSVQDIEELQGRLAELVREIVWDDYRDYDGLLLPAKSTERVFEVGRRGDGGQKRIAVSRERRIVSASVDRRPETPIARASVPQAALVADWRHDPPLTYESGRRSAQEWLRVLRGTAKGTPSSADQWRRREALVGHGAPEIRVDRWIGPRKDHPPPGGRRLVVFGASAFPAGVAQLTLLKAAAARLAARDVSVVLVLRSTDDPDTARRVLAPLLRHVHCGVDSFYDDTVWQSATFRNFAVSSIPCAFLIEADNTVSRQGELPGVLAEAMQ